MGLGRGRPDRRQRPRHRLREDRRQGGRDRRTERDRDGHISRHIRRDRSAAGEMRRPQLPRDRRRFGAIRSIAFAVLAGWGIPNNPEGGIAAGDSEMNALNRFFGRDDGEEGQAVVLFAIMMLALLFAVGLAIDAGQLYSAKRTEQEAADASAFAAAVVLYQQGTGAEAIAAARTDALTNGYSSGGVCVLSTPGPCFDAATQTTVTVNWPPLSGTYIGNIKHVEVEITRQVKTSLVPAEAAFNPVRARGVAGSEPLNNGYAVMALDSAPDNRAFWSASNAEVHLHGGGILVNSGGSNASDNDQNNAGKFSTDG